MFAVAVGEPPGRPVTISGNFDRTVRVWDLESEGRATLQIELQHWAHSVAPTADGRASDRHHSRASPGRADRAVAEAANAERDRGGGGVSVEIACALFPVGGIGRPGQPPGWPGVEANMSMARKSARAWDTSTGRPASSDRNASSGQVAR